MSLIRKTIWVAVLCLSMVSADIASANVLQEAWYEMRAGQNMKIGNYEAAIEAYEKYLQLKPNDRDALKGIALAYEKQGDTDKAISRYDKYLAQYQDDPEIAFKQANFLIWSRYDYRKEDAIKYFRMGLEAQDNPEERLKLAQLLAEEKYDLAAAVKQYEILLEQQPGNEAIGSEYRDVLLWDNRYLSKAIEQFEYLVNRNPRDFAARKQLAELLRKTSNRKDEALDIYAQLVEEKPADHSLRRDYARLLTQTSGHFEEARKQYQILLSRQSDTALMAEAAAQLEQRQAHRPEALELYNSILKQEPGNTAIRLKRASIYMDDQSTAARALADYEYVLDQDARNADAHRGAARALAWMERPDDALHHAQLARQYGEDDASSQLQRQLSEGREPRLTAALDLFHQDGDDNYELQGVRFGGGVSGELSPYISASAKAGMEYYEGENDNASGGWWQVTGEYRLDPQQKINVSVEHHGLREVGDTTTFAASYTHNREPELWSYTAGYAGEALDDSYLALVGDRTNDIGGATQHELYADFSTGDTDRRYSIRPYLGWVESGSEDSNGFLGVDSSARFALSDSERLKTFFGSDLTLMSYAEDHSGFGISNDEPRSGGYFSPQTFASILLFADAVYSIGGSGELSARLGPKFQLVDDANSGNEVESGFYGSIAYTHKRSEALYLIVRAEHDQVGSLYQSSTVRGQMVYIF